MKTIYKLDLVVALYIFCIVVAETMGSKTFPLVTWGSFTLNASVAIFVLPFIFTLNDVVTEVYGKDRARSMARSSLFIVFLVMVFSILATTLPPSTRFAASESAYDQVFHTSARISAASLIAFAVAEFSDIIIFTSLRKKLGHRALWLRNNVSNMVAQFFDTSLFMTFAFYDFSRSPQTNGAFLLSLILPYWLLKCVASLVETPLVYGGVKWLKKDT